MKTTNFNTQTFRNSNLRLHSHQSSGLSLKNFSKNFETIENVDFNLIINLPEGEDLYEWYAYNVFDFHRQATMLFSAITEFCTPSSCPVMTAGSGYKYLWSEDGSKPCELCAPEYTAKLLKWIRCLLDNENVFPSTPGMPFGPDFENIIKTIMKRLFRIYAHFYYHHLQHFKALKIEKYLNTSFKHFILFNAKYQLIDEKYLSPLRDLINCILKCI